LWFNNRIVVSARRNGRKLLSIEDIRGRIADKHGPTSTGDFVSMLTEHLANRISDVVDKIDDDLIKFETDLNDDNLRHVQMKLSATRKQAAAIRRYLAPQREALVELTRSRKILSEEDTYSLQHQTDRIIHYVEDLDLAREQALVLQSDLQNRFAEQQNSRMYLLSIVAAIFLPLSFLTGVFGMNVAGLPGIENPHAFIYLSFAMLGVAIGLVAYMWWKRWL
jgi:zinc transporter